MVRWAASPNQLPPFLSTEPFAWREIEPLDGEWREIEHEPLGGWGRGASAPVTPRKNSPRTPGGGVGRGSLSNPIRPRGAVSPLVSTATLRTTLSPMRRGRSPASPSPLELSPPPGHRPPMLLPPSPRPWTTTASPTELSGAYADVGAGERQSRGLPKPDFDGGVIYVPPHTPLNKIPSRKNGLLARNSSSGNGLAALNTEGRGLARMPSPARGLARAVSPPRLPAGINVHAAPAVRGENVQQKVRERFERLELECELLQSDVSEVEGRLVELGEETRCLREGEVVPIALLEQLITHVEEDVIQKESDYARYRDQIEDVLREEGECHVAILRREIGVAEQTAADLRARLEALEARDAATSSGVAIAEEQATLMAAVIDDVLGDLDADEVEEEEVSGGSSSRPSSATSGADDPESIPAPPPGWNLEKWLSGYSFDKIVSDAILARIRAKLPAGQNTARFEQAFMLKLNRAGSRDLLVALLQETPVLYQIADMIVKGASGLQSEIDAAEEDKRAAAAEAVVNAPVIDAVTAARLKNEDFQKAGAFTLTYATEPEFFFQGVGRVTGPPTSQLEMGTFEAMEAEHCDFADSPLPFDPGNYGYSTTAPVEWNFVVDPLMKTEQASNVLARVAAKLQALVNSTNSAAPTQVLHGWSNARQVFSTRGSRGFRDVWPGTEGRAVNRVARPLSFFAKKRAEIDAKLIKIGEQATSDEELFALRLYTGPMFVKYNSTLRGARAKGTAIEFMYTRWWDLCRGNTYSTTLHVISAAIVKLSKITQASKVYRAPGGALPPSFWHRNATSGVQGGLECGFMSTTLNKEEAMKYARRAPGAVLFEIDQGFVARGASVSWLSQYPAEEEILLPPFTALEVANIQIEGAVVVCQLRPSLSSAVAASGLRTGADDIVAMQKMRENLREKAALDKLDTQMKIAREQQRLNEERGRWRAESAYQAKVASLRMNALRRREAQLEEKLAESQQKVKEQRFQMAKAMHDTKETKSQLEAQMNAAVEARKRASEQLRKQQEKLEESNRELNSALEAKAALGKGKASTLWNLLRKDIRDKAKMNRRNSEMFHGLKRQLTMMALPAEALEEVQEVVEEPVEEVVVRAKTPSPGTRSPKDVDQFRYILNLNAATLLPKMKEWVGPRESWGLRVQTDVTSTLKACERLVQFSDPRLKEDRKMALELGGIDVLADAMRKAAVSGAEEPLVIAYAFEAVRALISGTKQKELDKVMQGPAADAIPGVIQGANAVLDLMLLSVVRLITKDNYDRTAYALRTNCPVAWLDPESKIPIGEDGKLAPMKKK